MAHILILLLLPSSDVVIPLTDANADTVASTTERLEVIGPTSYNPPLVAGTLTGQHSK